MRLKRSELKEIHIKKRIVEKDSEGGRYETFLDAGTEKAIVWPASGKAQAEMYGERLNYIINLEIDGRYQIQAEDGVITYVLENGLAIREKDGISLHGSKQPEYQIIAVQPAGHLRMEAEKIVGRRS